MSVVCGVGRLDVWGVVQADLMSGVCVAGRLDVWSFCRVLRLYMWLI
jgi:hypothetical protein